MTKKNLLPEDSATVVINSIAQQKTAAGIKVFNLSAGEPKLPPHALIIQAVSIALHEGKTLYPPVSGIPELKKAATTWINATYACQYQPNQCLVVNGGKFGIYLLLQLLLQPDDEVIFAAPYWVSYPAISKLFGGKCITIETEQTTAWKFTAQQLKQVCTINSKVLLLNNAANPTGVLYSQQELAAILQVAKEHNLYVISDEVYSELTYDQQSYISCGAFNEYKENIIVIQSCSKNFAMTGWRIGFVFANTQIITQLTALLSQSTSGAATIGQWATVTACQHAKEISAWVKQTMQQRRDILIKALKEYFNLTIMPPASALYVFIALSDLAPGLTINPSEFCQKALEQANVALVPGIAFGKENYVRFSFGAEEEDLIGGVKALKKFVNTL